MKSFRKIQLFSAICAMALVVTSCEKEPQGPSQQAIESSLIGRWKIVSIDGKYSHVDYMFTYSEIKK